MKTEKQLIEHELRERLDIAEKLIAKQRRALEASDDLLREMAYNLKKRSDRQQQYSAWRQIYFDRKF